MITPYFYSVVVEGDGPSLIGRNWLTELRLDRRAVYAISLSHSLEGILEQDKEIFQQGLGKIKGIEAKLYVDTQAIPLYFKAHLTLRQKVEQELYRESRCHHTCTIFGMGYTYSPRGQK